ncbi:MAG TPA: metallopeptidase TldD-related protein [Candidatus Limnocylindrales bacterium]|nr:metallopeptidase TldD-related protein [Candidatus Limnocylindrales bacterium]
MIPVTRKFVPAARAFAAVAILFSIGCLAPLRAQQWPAADADQTLNAMHDELERSRTRMQLPNVEKPYFIQYRLVDLDIRTITASFGALVSTTTAHNRLMDVGVRIGDYKLDSSNFISGGNPVGFLGSAGQVGVDGDYNSLRQDLWIATDQAYKQALDDMARKQGYLRSLSKPPEIADFSQEKPVVMVNPRVFPDWTNRNWGQEAKQATAALRAYPGLYANRITYTLIYETYYVMNTEGTRMRVSRTISAIESSIETQAPEGVPMHHFYSTYVTRPADLPSPAEVSRQLDMRNKELMALRTADPMPAYSGPVLFEARAAAAVLAQMLGPSVIGSRAPLSLLPIVDQLTERLGGRSEWSGRIGSRVLPTEASLVDDPSATDSQGRPLAGSYVVDDEGVPSQRVSIVEAGILRNFDMSRRPGSDFAQSNGHGRNILLGEARAASSNLVFRSANGISAADLKKKFLAACKDEGRQWCLLVREMDNPAVGISRQEELNSEFQDISAGASSGERVPLVVYKVNVADGTEELMRPGHLLGLNLRVLRDASGFGNDPATVSYAQSQEQGIAGTALAAYGTVDNGVPSTISAPAVLFPDVEVREARGEMRRLPLVPPPPMQ